MNIIRTILIASLAVIVYAYNPNQPWRFELDYGPEEREHLVQYIRSNLHSYVKRKYDPEVVAHRYLEIILEHSLRSSTDPIIIARQIKVESHFRWWAKGPVIGYHIRKNQTNEIRAIGASQIVVRNCWEGTLHKNLSKRDMLKALQSKDPWRFYERMAQNIDYAIKTQVDIMNYYLKKHKYYPLALMAYNRGDREWRKGKLTKFGRAKRNINVALNDKYVKYIMHH